MFWLVQETTKQYISLLLHLGASQRQKIGLTDLGYIRIICVSWLLPPTKFDSRIHLLSSFFPTPNLMIHLFSLTLRYDSFGCPPSEQIPSMPFWDHLLHGHFLSMTFWAVHHMNTLPEIAFGAPTHEQFYLLRPLYLSRDFLF